MKRSVLALVVGSSIALGVAIGWNGAPRSAESELVASMPPESIAYVRALADVAKGWTKEDADAFLRDMRTEAKKAQDSSALWSIYDGVACFTIQQLKKDGKNAELDARLERSISGMLADFTAGRFAGLPEEVLARAVFRKMQPPEKEPNKSLEPTPGSVTPRATEGTSN